VSRIFGLVLEFDYHLLELFSIQNCAGKLFAEAFKWFYQRKIWSNAYYVLILNLRSPKKI